MSEIRVLNDPAHVCSMPDPATFPRGTDVQCWQPVVGGSWQGRCGRKYTRTSTWLGVPRWSDYDYGW